MYTIRSKRRSLPYFADGETYSTKAAALAVAVRIIEHVVRHGDSRYLEITIHPTPAVNTQEIAA